MAISYYFPINRTPGIRGIFLKEIDGYAESSLSGAGTPELLDWLSSLMEVRKNNEAIQAEKITVSDRDHLLASIYKSLYGSRISSSIECNQCNSLFDFSFSLDDFIQHIRFTENIIDIKEKEEGAYVLPDGTFFRLPTGEDELTILQYPEADQEKEMLQRCLLQKKREMEIPENFGDKITEAMSQLAPILESDLKTVCPECHSTQTVHFDVQSLLLDKMISEKKALAYQIHLIASSYGWDYDQILALPRRERQTYSALIESDSR